MSVFASRFAAKAGLSLAGLCVAAAVLASGGGAASASYEECPPPSTTTVTVDLYGNPWYG
ncbi:hypothetical protein [Saccharothrix sp. HUAS TT1]|uniref:hypothetical protein n=1 Tax=unclassified Saccharothrix TaxID=2593673 RepID=UPI00345B53F8